ncbi:HpcH/HpaI aldolase family protein [Halobaculum lipolyticum]|uniref:HpcH/HpaI aldolase/citrate lyase family protein n=1 Tax=Halobaculum lipolyticum TaxID=3032001 RepID=A0ABD5WCF6_9EURY|nr:aldolase/citrate lyase family protein [Halobaculum sp. DT31]
MASTDSPRTIREHLDAGDVALGVLDSAYSPTLVELYGELGVDFVWIDLEHGGPSPDAPELEHLLRAAERTGTDLLVRTPDTEPTTVRKCLDVGVRSLFLPRVESAHEVSRAVRSARFRVDGVDGDRGLASPRASRWGTVDDYVAREDRETLVGTTVETRAAVDDIDGILDVPELGFVFVGPFDLSVSFGHPGELDHPDVEAAVETVVSAALDAGVPVGGLGFGMDDVNEKVDAGYRIVNLGSTTGALASTVDDWFDGYDGDRDGR